MGLLLPPWVTTRFFAWDMEIRKGDCNSSDNKFNWSQVILNCPGSGSYNISMPRVYKWNKNLGCIAGDCNNFVDDHRPICDTLELCCETNYQVETMMGYLGLQNATIRRLHITQYPGELTRWLVCDSLK